MTYLGFNEGQIEQNKMIFIEQLLDTKKASMCRKNNIHNDIPKYNI